MFKPISFKRNHLLNSLKGTPKKLKITIFDLPWGKWRGQGDRMTMQQKIFIPICLIIIISVGMMTIATYTLGKQNTQNLVKKQLEDSAKKITETIVLLQWGLDSREFEQKLQYRLQTQKAEFEQMGLDLEQFFVDRQGQRVLVPGVREEELIDLEPSQLQQIAEQLNGVEHYRLQGRWYTVAYAFSPERQLVYALAVRDDQYLQPIYRQCNLLLGIGTAVLVLAFLSIFLVARKVSKPIDRLVCLINEIEQGNLTRQENPQGVGRELGRLVITINNMTAEIRKVLQEVNLTTEQLNSVGEMMSEDADRSSVSMEQIIIVTQTLVGVNEAQAAAGQRTLTLLTEVEAAVNQIVTKINHTADRSQIMRHEATAGQNSLNRMIQQIEDIQKVSTESIWVVQDLVTHSSEISRIVEVIKTVAQQTKLLALNATIEAARAGRHGSGFMVVAEEVQQLAQYTTESTRSISELLNLVQTGGLRAVHMSKQVGQAVNEGVTIAGEANQALNKIFVGIEEIDANILEILGSSKEIAQAVEEMRKATDTVSENIAASVAGTKQIANGLLIQQGLIDKVSASSLAQLELAAKLRKIIDRFSV